MPFKKLRRQGKLNCRQASAHSSFAEMAAALGLRLVKQTPTRMISSHWSKGFYDRNRYPLPGWQAPETKKAPPQPEGRDGA